MTDEESLIETLSLFARMNPKNRDEQILCGEKVGPLLPEVVRRLTDQAERIADLERTVETQRIEILNTKGIMDRLTRENSDMRQFGDQDVRAVVDRAIEILQTIK